MSFDAHAQAATLLEHARVFMRDYAASAEGLPPEYPGRAFEPAHIELVEVLEQSGRLIGRFCADFPILYGTQSGSDWYDYVVLLGRIEVSPDGALLEAVAEHARRDRLTEHEWEGLGRPRYDRREARARFLADHASSYRG